MDYHQQLPPRLCRCSVVVEEGGRSPGQDPVSTPEAHLSAEHREKKLRVVVHVAIKVYQQVYLSACLPQLLNHPLCLAFPSVTAIFLFVQLLSSILPNTFYFSHILPSTFNFLNSSSLILNEPPSRNPELFLLLFSSSFPVSRSGSALLHVKYCNKNE